MLKMVISGIVVKVIALPPERWKHITTEHPEVKKLKNKIKEVSRKPDIVKGSKRDKNVWLYYKFKGNLSFCSFL